jgi:tetratricopeptide (TPR) repeat protein
VLSLAITAGAPARAQTLDQALNELRGGDPDNAAKMLAALVDRAPDDPQPRFWYGRALINVGKNPEAAEQFRRVLKLRPNSTDSLYWLGFALELQGDDNGAREAWKAVLAKAPNYEAAKEALAKLNLPGGAPIAKPTGMATAKPGGLERDRVMADLGASGVDIGDLDVRDRNVVDCTFASAPTDWYIAAGNWGTTNRWVCSPQWSW